ncbi:ribonuclease P protein component [Paenibacillus yanchengensis]|uniref:Ribonuclease P protein component n=1 Tax=Paenibacillus yanchengensis TaxID=2035833 RepID=A0ABW4YNY5_9BACL
MQRKLRLRNRADFSRIYRNGKSFANGQFVVYWSHQKVADPFRVGVSASKKIGNAVVRNRMRRIVKEIMRRYEGKLQPNIDIIIIVRKPAITMHYQELEKSIAHVLRRAALIKKK